MSFLHPEFFYYMLPPLFILFGLLLTQKETQAHFFSEEVMSKLRVSANTLTLKARNALFFLMAIFMVTALAQPVIKDGEVEIKAKSADIMIGLDISDSMLAEDVYPNRLKMAKQKAIEFLNMDKSERVGVIAFAKNSYLVSPLSFDHGAVSFLLSQLDTDSITEKGTDFLSMLDVVNKSLKKHNKKYLLVLSDGGDKKDFSKEIAFAKEHEIVVFVLGVGTAKGAPIKLKNGSFIKQHGEIIVSKLNENIADLATQTGGVYIEYTNSNEDMKAMLLEIEKVSEKKELKSEKIERYIPLFYFPLGMALLLLLIATSSMSKRESVALPSAFLMFALMFTTPELKAGVLDFVQLGEAKKAYEEHNYAKASKIYEEYAQKSHNGESYYNAGNAYYKEKNYKKAIEAYEKATFDNKAQRAQNFANLGNAYAKTGDMKNLQKAIEAYEKSLKIQEDKDVKENLEMVKKLLKEQEQKNQNKDSKKNDKQDKDKQNKDQKSSDSKKNKDSEGKEKDSKNKDKSDKDQQNKENESKDKKSQDQKSDSQNKEDKNKDKSEQNSGENSQENKKNKSDKQAPQDENNTSKDKKKKKPDLKQLSKDEQKEKEDKHKNKKQDSSPANSAASKQMSDAEEAKWLKQLNLQQSTYLYMLNDQRPREEKTDEKPW